MVERVAQHCLMSPVARRNADVVQANMVFNVAVGLSDLPNPDAKRESQKMYSLLLADTVLVVPQGPAEVLTAGKKEFADVSFEFKGEGRCDVVRAVCACV